MIPNTKFQFENLTVYQEAIIWTDLTYSLSQSWPKREVYGLTNQWQRAATSIALNIAEGSSRTNKDFCHILDIARGSCYECVAILAIAKKREYMTSAQYDTCYEYCNL